MKGYVTFIVEDGELLNRMVAFLATAENFIKDYKVENYSTEIIKKTWFTRKDYVSGWRVNDIDDLLLPIGVRCLGYDLHWSCLDDIERVGHKLELSFKAKAVKRILSLVALNSEVMLDDDLARVYNSFTN